MSRTTILQLSCLVKCSDLFTPNYYYLTNELGVYIWGFKFKNDLNHFIPYYVGQAGGDSNKEKPPTSIYSRLDTHYNFKQPYNVIKAECFEKFIKEQKLKTDNEIDQLTKNDLLDYRKLFAYLNKANEKNSRGHYPALNDPNRYQNIDAINGIANMKEHMYVCWISVNEQLGDYINKQIATRKHLIKELERFVHTKIKSKHKLSGKVLGKPHGNEFHFSITSQCKEAQTLQLLEILNL